MQPGFTSLIKLMPRVVHTTVQKARWVIYILIIRDLLVELRDDVDRCLIPIVGVLREQKQVFDGKLITPEVILKRVMPHLDAGMSAGPWRMWWLLRPHVGADRWRWW